MAEFQRRNAHQRDAENGRWYVVQTQPRGEAKAMCHLERQRFVTFCPKTQKTVRHARQTATVQVPLFPGYLFVWMDVGSTPWRSINGTFGVSHLLTQNDLPQPVPSGIIEELQTYTDNGTVDWANKLKVGQAIRVNDGPFVELIGTLQSLDAKGRVHVLMEIMGRKVSVITQADLLLPETS